MPNGNTIKAWINPLAFIELEGPSADTTASISAEAILRFLCLPETAPDNKSFVERYKRISEGQEWLSVAPAETKILEKLVWPLRQAKASYILGNNLAAVALCGMVAEMVAVLLWRLAETKLNGETLTEKYEAEIFGSRFDRLGQERRIKILSAYGIIAQADVKDFDKIRLTRNLYLHRWSEDHTGLSEDAEECFRAATRLVAKVIGQDFQDGEMRLNPRLWKYLQEKGVVEPDQDSAV